MGGSRKFRQGGPFSEKGSNCFSKGFRTCYSEVTVKPLVIFQGQGGVPTPCPPSGSVHIHVSRCLNLSLFFEKVSPELQKLLEKN